MDGGGRRRRRERERGRHEPELGTGLWQRTYADCTRAATEVPELGPLLPQVHARALDGQRRWPSQTLDVPADADGRAAYEHLRAVRRAMREASYRARLLTAQPDDPTQLRLRDEAVQAAAELLR